MTHDDSKQHKKNSDVDEHLLAKLPFGIHFDSLEAKWILIGLLTGAMLALTGSVELLAAIGPIALGARTTKTKRFPKIAALEAQPWYWIGGVMVGLPIFMAVRWQLTRMGASMPDIDYGALASMLAGAV